MIRPVNTPEGSPWLEDRGDRLHFGVDFPAPMGSPAVAVAPATVAKVYTSATYGRTVILDHGGGVYSLYAHLKEATVEEGQKVKTGQVVGLIGSTGRSTGPHLHFERIESPVSPDDPGFWDSKWKKDPAIFWQYNPAPDLTKAAIIAIALILLILILA